MKILFIGDVVASPGREAVKSLIPELKKEFGIEFIIVNAENAAGGSGITARVAGDLFDSGADILTSGDHIWKKRDIFEIINQEP
ncbi:MAG: YmdB family metallophosphoesterase, partial [Candidatus Omnitrophota bacterium]